MAASPFDIVLRLTAAVGTARTLPEIYDAALDGLRDAFGVERASILLFDPDGVMRFKAWRGLSSEYRAAVEGHTPWRLGQPAPEPVVVPDVRAEASLESYQAVFERERIVGLAFVPLVAEGGVIGKFMLYTGAPAAFTYEELNGAKALGFLIGFAVERTERAVAAQRERQSVLFALDAAQMGTWDWNVLTNQLTWSENLERIHGLPPGTFDGTFECYAREIHPEDRDRVLGALQRALTELAPHDVEYRIVAPDGAVRWVLGKGRVERNAEGAPVRMSGVCMDVSVRKRIEAENAALLGETQRLFAEEAGLRERLTTLTDGSLSLLTSLSAGSVMSDVIALAAKVVDADAYAVWRQKEGEWYVDGSRGLGEAFASVRFAWDRRQLPFDQPVVAADPKQMAVLSSRISAYASERIASFFSVPLLVRGEPLGSIVFYYRTPHEPSEAELRVALALGQLSASAIANAELYEEQQALRRSAEASQVRAAFLAEASAQLSSLDYERNLQTVARLAVPTLADWCAVDLREGDDRLTRLTIAHVDPAKVALAQELHDRYPPDLSRPYGIGEVLRTGLPVLYSQISDEILAETARDEAHLAILRALSLQSAMIVPLAAGGKVFGVLTFVSSSASRRYDEADLQFATELGRRAALAVENARLYKEAQEANRLKDEFLATVSHELRTPLNVIQGRTRMMLGAGDLETALENGRIVARNAEALGRLVDDLLDVSRMNVGQIALERQPVLLAPVVESSVLAVQPALEAKRITLIMEAQPDLPPLLGDPTRIQQIVWNLLTNAVKFTPPEGRIRVEASLLGGHLALSVSDSGQGIAPEALGRVFEPFWQGEPTSSRQYGGLGLGLSIVRRLVELHGGDVRAHSDGPGLGSTFTVTLPCSPSASTAAP